MTVAHDYDELHHLVDCLSPDQARRLLRLVKHDPEFVTDASAASAGKSDEYDEESLQQPSIVGCIAGGPADLAERSKDYLMEYFNNSS